jgi:hypothetical protein
MLPEKFVIKNYKRQALLLHTLQAWTAVRAGGALGLPRFGSEERGKLQRKIPCKKVLCMKESQYHEFLFLGRSLRFIHY